MPINGFVALKGACFVISVVAIALLGECSKVIDKEEGCFGNELPAIASVPDAAWQELALKKIYFGHQSVGFNIIDGMKQLLKQYPSISLPIENTADTSAFGRHVFAHSTNGANTLPQTKISEFRLKMENGLGARVDIAFFKFCYIDFNASTDVPDLFNRYSKTMATLAQAYPKVHFLHCTVPLTVRDNRWVKKIVRAVFEDNNDLNNEKRNDFNRMLRDKYQKEGTLFDLAAFESTYPNNSREVFKRKGKSIYCLINKYSSDGGHLNDTGKKLLAEKLLVFLALHGNNHSNNKQ
jgi:hypothetical protein